MNNQENTYSKKAIFIVPCILSSGLQAEYKFSTNNTHWGNNFIKLLIENNIDIFSLPCAESSFHGYDIGLKRKKHGIDYYTKLEGFNEYCEKLAIEYAEKYYLPYSAGYEFLAILGVEHSPTCAISYIYSHKGMLKYIRNIRI